MGNHRLKRAKMQEFYFFRCAHHRLAGTRTLPHYRKTEDVYLQAIRFETQTTSTVIDIFMGSIR
jgi:hypothetical protein